MSSAPGQRARICADSPEPEWVRAAPGQNGCGQHRDRMGASSTGAIIGVDSNGPELMQDSTRPELVQEAPGQNWCRQHRARIGAGQHRARIGVGSTGVVIGAGQLWSRIGAGQHRARIGVGKHPARIGAGQHSAGALGSCPKNCSHSGGVALISYQTLSFLVRVWENIAGDYLPCMNVKCYSNPGCKLS